MFSRGDLVRWGKVVDKLQIRDSDWLKFPPHVVSPYRDELQIWINCFG